MSPTWKDRVWSFLLNVLERKEKENENWEMLFLGCDDDLHFSKKKFVRFLAQYPPTLFPYG